MRLARQLLEHPLAPRRRSPACRRSRRRAQTAVSTPSTGRSPASGCATERALPRACSRTSSTGVGVRRVVLLVVRRDDVERDAELLEDHAALRARRREQDRVDDVRAHRFRALQISSHGQRFRPLRGDGVVVLVPSRRPRARTARLELEDVEAGLSQEREELAERQVELGRPVVLPVEPVQPALRPLQLLACQPSSARAEDRERRVAQEDELAARPEQPRRLRDPAVGVAPDRRAVLGERDVERRIRQRHVLRVRLEQRELDARSPAAARRAVVELCGRDVDADRPRTAASQPGGEVGGAAAELDDVLPGDVGQRVQLGLGHSRQTPT